MSGIARKIRRKARKEGLGRGSAAVGAEFVRRMPEVGEKFILAGPDWVTPAVFELEGYTADGAAIIRFATKDEVTAPGAPITGDLPGLPGTETGVVA